MNLKYLEAFCVVSELKNFAAASRQLFISQPALTKQIQNIESELGIKLLDRTPHSFTLTPAGEIFLEGAKQITDIYNSTAEKIACNGLLNRTITIGYMGSTRNCPLPWVLTDFMNKYSDWNIITKNVKLMDIKKSLESGDIDLIIASSDLVASQSIKFVKLYHDQHYCITSANNKNCNFSKDEIDISDLANQSIVVPYPDLRPPHFVNLQKQIIEKNPSTIFYEGYTLESAMFQVKCSSMISILPSYMAPHTHEYRLFPVNDGIEITIGIAYSGELSTEKKFLTRLLTNICNDRFYFENHFTGNTY